MQHLLIATTLVTLVPTAAPAEEALEPAWHPLAVSARLGMLAMETGATTRAAASEIVVGGQWYVLPEIAAALSYRGGMRRSGNDAVGMRITHHRVELGVRGCFTRVLIVRCGSRCRPAVLLPRNAG